MITGFFRLFKKCPIAGTVKGEYLRLVTMVAIFLSVSVSSALAQSIKVDAPNIVGENERFNVTFIIEGEDRPSEFKWEPGDDFTLVWGPQTGSSTSIRIINGKRSKSSQFTYVYVLSPNHTGKCTIPPAIARIKGDNVESSPVHVDVLVQNDPSVSHSGNSSQSTSSDVRPNSSTGDISKEDLYLKLTVSDRSVVIGEPVTAELKLYQRVDIAGFEGAKFPSFNGFWSQETAAPTNIEFRREDVDGRIYNSALIRRYVIIPQQSGQMTIDPAELVCLVNVRTPSRSSNSIFDSFFDDGFTTVRKRITSPAVTVNVKPLPAGAPAGFGGGVGKFSIKAKLGKDQLKMHEATSLVITVAGRGNVSLLEAPDVKFPHDIEVYDVKTTENVDKSSGGVSGSKTFEYPFIPRSHGEFTIDPIVYSYYDVNEDKYVTISTEPLVFNVEKAAGSSASVSESSGIIMPERKDVKNVGEDIRFIVRDMPSFSGAGAFFVLSPLYWVFVLMIAVLAAAAYYMFRRFEARRADVVGSRNRRATRMAMNRLKTAENYLKQNLASAFYEELHRSLLGFVADKLNMSVEDLNKETILSRLSDAGADSSLGEGFVSLLDECEFARYSPHGGNNAMSAHYNEALRLISTIDSSMKTSKKSSSGVAGATMAIMLLMLPFSMKAEPSSYLDSLWTKGVASYAEGRWQESAESWEAMLEAGASSKDLYYNLGNAWFKSSEYAKAILNYERALKIDPSMTDARFNLEFANSLIQDKIDVVPEFILKSWARQASYLMPSDSWAVFSLILLALAAGLLLLFFLGRSSAARRTGFYAGVLVMLLSIGSFGLALWQKNIYQRSDTAIVMRPVVTVRSSPSAESSKDLFVLHEGTKVNVLDSVGEWYNISLSDGRQGWISSSEMEII